MLLKRKDNGISVNAEVTHDFDHRYKIQCFALSKFGYDNRRVDRGVSFAGCGVWVCVGFRYRG